MPCINYTTKADSKKQRQQEEQQQQHLLNRTVSLLAEPQGPVPDISGPMEHRDRNNSIPFVSDGNKYLCRV